MRKLILLSPTTRFLNLYPISFISIFFPDVARKSASILKPWVCKLSALIKKVSFLTMKKPDKGSDDFILSKLLTKRVVILLPNSLILENALSDISPFSVNLLPMTRSNEMLLENRCNISESLVSSCWRSQSITATNSEVAAKIPSITAPDNPLLPIL